MSKLTPLVLLASERDLQELRQYVALGGGEVPAFISPEAFGRILSRMETDQEVLTDAD